MAEPPRTLVVVAHPDDESLWFSTVIRRRRADVVCVSCGHAGDRERRRAEFRNACALLGAGRVELLDHDDDPTRSLARRLDVARLVGQLAAIAGRGYAEVYTHAPLGEAHEHPHHQDVSHAVHQCFANVWSNAWNQRPSRRHELDADEYALKKHLLGSVYWHEYVNLKATYEIGATESYCRHDPRAVAAFYAAIAGRPRHPRTGVLPYLDPLTVETGRQSEDTRRIVGDLLVPLGPRSLLGIGVDSPALRGTCTAVLGLPAGGFVVAPDAAGSARVDAVIAGIDPAAAGDKLAGVDSRWLLLVSPADPAVAAVVDTLRPRYRVLRRHLLPPCWEHLGPAAAGTDPLTVYRAGVLVTLLGKDDDAR